MSERRGRKSRGRGKGNGKGEGKEAGEASMIDLANGGRWGRNDYERVSARDGIGD